MASVTPMLRTLAFRLGSLLLSLWLASVAIFLVLQAVPGDPAAFMLGTGARPETVAALRAELGLEGALPARYLGWVGGMLTGDLGTSYTYRSPVSRLVADRVGVSVPLAAYALTLTILIALPVGVIAAMRRGRIADWGIMGATQLGIAVPNFWFAMLLVLVFAVRLGWAPAGGFPGWEDPGRALGALTLPAIALALPQASILARVLRSALLEVLEQDYIRTARAKGLSRRATVLSHGLRNAAIAVLTILGLQFSFLLAGAIIIENVFYLPGLGRLIFQAISARDLIVVQSVTMLLVCAVIVVTFATEAAYALADPRLRRMAAR